MTILSEVSDCKFNDSQVLTAVSVWEFSSDRFTSNTTFPSSRPFTRIPHDCQTGRWLTLLRAQWSPNPDAYPHFTVRLVPSDINWSYWLDSRSVTWIIRWIFIPRRVIILQNYMTRQGKPVGHRFMKERSDVIYRITAVQAVTCSHPSIVERVATGNASGRCILWAPADSWI